MENKIIEGTDLNPRISLEMSGNIEISGKSRMEDASLFYKPLHDWIAEYIAGNIGSLSVKIKLDYFNSSSAKQILKLLMTIDEANINGKVIWIYPAGNDVLLERGQELEIMLDLPFEYQDYAA
jgi:hypothetical protein